MCVCVCGHLSLAVSQLAVARVLTADAPSLETIKLQIVFHTDYSSEERKLIKKRVKRDEESETALNEITELSKKLKNEQQGRFRGDRELGLLNSAEGGSN